MIKKEIARPNEEAMRRLLTKYVNRVEEVVFRLAWQAGLTRQEILDLKWTDISFDDGMINLPRRSVPIVEDLSICLGVRRLMASSEDLIDSVQPYVVVTDGYHTHPTKVHLSRLVAAAIDEEESLRGLRLDDLRNDYIIRILEKNSTTYAMEKAGINWVTVNGTFADYLPPASEKEKRKKEDVSLSPADEAHLLKIIRAEGSSPEAIAMQCAFELGILLEDMVSLTWDKIDLKNKILLQKDKVYSISEEFAEILRGAFMKRTPEDDPHVFLGITARHPLDRVYLAKTVKNKLIRGGLEHIRMNHITRRGREKEREQAILSFVREHGSIQNKQVIELLEVSNMSAYRYLCQMVEKGMLIKEKQKCYLPKE